MKHRICSIKSFLLSLLLVVAVISLSACGNQPATSSITENKLPSGGIFETGSFILVEDVRILYDGKSFFICNNRSDIVRVSCAIVGVKNDGTYDTIQMVSFGGTDETLYVREKSENGWAIKQFTNLVRPSETLNAKMEIFDFNDAESQYPKNDIDGDGYLDVVFTISPQPDEKTVTTSSTDPHSEVYKIKVK